METNFREKLIYARDYTTELLKRIWPYVIIGIALGGIVHGYIPTDFVVKYAGRDNPFAVLVAVLIGVPLYSNAAGMIPVVQALVGKGMAMGTVLAFMMSVTAISFPEAVILKNVLKMRLIYTFFGIVAALSYPRKVLLLSLMPGLHAASWQAHLSLTFSTPQGQGRP